MTTKREFLLRSPMFVPAFNRRYIDKAILSDADALILDVEDSVPLENKQEAREILADYFSRGVFRDRQVFIRINALETSDFVADMEQLVFEDLDGYMPPKIHCAQDLVLVDNQLTLIERKHGYPNGKFVLAPLIESAAAIVHINEIAHASSRLIALCFGGEDYLDSMQSAYTHLTPAFIYPRNAIAIAARSAGLLPIDTPYLEISDAEGFMEEEREMYKMGFAGCLLLNPKQIELAHQAFSPLPEEIEHAEGVVAAIEEAMTRGTGMAVFKGIAIGPPMRKLALKVLAQRDLIQRLAVKRG
ncbi:MAG: CoA ester lyase [Planctomycetia bacterium]|nr:CoA ester lyase [Planctomycetia bacterium]